MVKQVRHSFMLGETIHTRYGVVKLDQYGMVINLEELSCTPAQLTENVPGFLDADTFPPKNKPPSQPATATGGLPGLGAKAPEPKRRETKPADEAPPAEIIPEPTTDAPAETTEDPAADPKKDGVEQTDEVVWKVIEDLLSKGANTNSEGYIDMKALNEELRGQGFEIITGTKRKQITDAFKTKA